MLASAPESTSKELSSGLYVLLAVKVTDDAIPESEYAHLSTEDTDPPSVCAVPSPPEPHADALENPVSEEISAVLESNTPAQARAHFVSECLDMG